VDSDPAPPTEDEEAVFGADVETLLGDGNPVEAVKDVQPVPKGCGIVKVGAPEDNPELADVACGLTDVPFGDDEGPPVERIEDDSSVQIWLMVELPVLTGPEVTPDGVIVVSDVFVVEIVTTDVRWTVRVPELGPPVLSVDSVAFPELYVVEPVPEGNMVDVLSVIVIVWIVTIGPDTVGPAVPEKLPLVEVKDGETVEPVLRELE
jgi:hypothetical protein